MYLSQLLYISDVVDPIDLNGLLAIQEVSIRNNARQNITGILLHSQGQFVQFLEGENTAVQELFKTISKDSRHTNIKLLYHRPGLDRYFEKWHMAMLDLELQSKIDRMALQNMVKLAGCPSSDRYGPPADLEALRHIQRLLAGRPTETS